MNRNPERSGVCRVAQSWNSSGPAAVPPWVLGWSRSGTERGMGRCSLCCPIVESLPVPSRFHSGPTANPKLAPGLAPIRSRTRFADISKRHFCHIIASGSLPRPPCAQLWNPAQNGRDCAAKPALHSLLVLIQSRKRFANGTNAVPARCSPPVPFLILSAALPGSDVGHGGGILVESFTILPLARIETFARPPRVGRVTGMRCSAGPGLGKLSARRNANPVFDGGPRRRPPF